MRNYNLLERFLFLFTYVNDRKFKQEVQGKTILITGASSGIGEKLAYQLASYEVHLILVARREDKLIEIKKIIDKQVAEVSIFCADLRNDEEIGGLIEFLRLLPQGLDTVISNAGKSINRPIVDSLDRNHDFTRTMAINYFAPVRLLLSVIPLLKEKSGQIINISTINALILPIPHWAAYQASKSAFDTWLRSAGPELKVMGITTTSIYLPLVNTPMILPTKAYHNMPAMSTEHVSNIIRKSIYTKKSIYRPWWLIIAQIASVFFRGIFEAVAARRLKKKGR
ncbi:epimerase [Halalkalibacillus sediminis]|uniref:Epimerase n=1 Tax=Halalkalibacillus sediminis TaxID=2018042 RepID=A0A2I0QRM2_9BACI|nr:epimerase [Halalkalibacillus sediminis]